jgi:hypothetical protein
VFFNAFLSVLFLLFDIIGMKTWSAAKITYISVKVMTLTFTVRTDTVYIMRSVGTKGWTKGRTKGGTTVIDH